MTHLSVEQNVDDRVVQSGTLSEEGWSGHEHRPKLSPLVGKDVPSYCGVWHPAHQEGDHHDNNHACHLFLCSLGGLRLLLKGCSLNEDILIISSKQ